jgi:hypothetical protein
LLDHLPDHLLELAFGKDDLVLLVPRGASPGFIVTPDARFETLLQQHEQRGPHVPNLGSTAPRPLPT